MTYRWAHHEYGDKGQDFARCGYCGEVICWWARAAPPPSAARKSIEKHLAKHEESDG